MDLQAGGWHAEGLAARSSRRWRRGVASALAGIGLLASPAVSQAQVTNITSSGLGTMVNQAGTIWNITGGTRPSNGPNLFHSFGLFSVGEGNIANFCNTAACGTVLSGIQNILGRVTGGRSDIFGTIRTEGFGSANLFLINPAGWVFGPSASLNVGGSFHVSTANYILLSDGVRFNATSGAADALLTSAPPAAFGFLGPTGSIETRGSILGVDRGKTLSLVGGDVTIEGGALTAPGGHIQIGSFAGVGEATVDGLNGAFASLGRVEISGGASISAAGDVRSEGDPPVVTVVDGGTVLIRGGQVDIVGASLDASGVLALDDTGNPLLDASGNPLATAGGAVVIRGGRLFVSSTIDGSSTTTIMSQTFGNEPGAPVGIDIRMDESITLTNGTSLLSETSGAGRGGDVHLAAGRVTIDGSVIATVSAGGGGVGGDVQVDGGIVALTNGGSIRSAHRPGQDLLGNFLVGRGGDITVTATESVAMSGASTVRSSTVTAGDGGQILISAPSLTMDEGASLLSTARFGEGPGGEIPGGAGGPIDVEVGRLNLMGGATINSLVSTTVPGVPGQGGSVTVAVAGEATIAGPGSGIFSIASQADPLDILTPGNVMVDVGTLRLTDGSLIQGGSFAEDSQGGNVTVRASDSILIAEGAGISSQARNLAVGRVEVSAQSLTIDRGFINTGTLGVGQAGAIVIDVGTLTLTRGGQIASSSIFTALGGGGDVTIRATESVTISGSSPDPVLPEPFRGFVRGTASGIFSTASSDNPLAGPGGQITVATPTLTMADGGTISVATTGEGAAGAVTLDVGNVTLMSGARVDSSTTGAGQGGNVTLTATGAASISGSGSPPSGLFSTASSTGNAGQVVVSAPTLTLADGGAISVATSGAGHAGDIALNLSNFTLAGGARVDSSTSGSGHGGTIAIDASGGMLTITGGGGLFSTAGGSGAGGDINVQAGQMQLLDGAIISARSTGTVDALAGNVNINAGSLLRMANSTITTESLVADGGNISITTTGSLVHLSDSQITTSVQSGIGSGGNIAIDSQLIVFDGSRIRADAFGGPGGNIDITAEVYLTQNSLVSASSALSTPGTINIQASITDVSGTLARLPEAVLQAAALLRASCAARLAGGKSSSLVLAGREGLPLEPGSLLPSPLVLEGPAEVRLSSREEHPWWETFLRVPRVSLDPTCSR